MLGDLPTTGFPEDDGSGNSPGEAAADLRTRITWIALLPTALLTTVGATAATILAIDRSYWVAALVIGVLGVAVTLLVEFNIVERTRKVVDLLRQRHDTVVRRATNTPTEAASPDEVPTASPYSNEGLQTAFVKLARRLESMADRAITEIDEAEHQVEDPDLLGRIFRVDHLVNLSRRQAENLAILGGKAPQRQSRDDVSLQTVLRSAVAEIEHYPRVKMTSFEGTLKGPAVAEVIQLLAELLENATQFSRDNTPVVLRTETVTAGLAIEIQDRGLGMTQEEIQRYNRLLDDTARVDLDELLADGRIGLSVVRVLAQRYGIKVRLQTSIYGGMDAVVLLPNSLLGAPPQEPEQPGGSARDTAARTPATRVPSEPVSEPVRPGVKRLTGDVEGPLPASPPNGYGKEPVPPKPASDAPPPRTHHPTADTTNSTTGGPRRRGFASDLPQRKPGKDNLPPALREEPDNITPIPGHNPRLLSAFGHTDTGDSGTPESRENRSNSN